MLENITRELETIRHHRRRMTLSQIHDRAKEIRKECEEMAAFDATCIDMLISRQASRSLRYGKAFFRRWEVFLERELGFTVAAGSNIQSASSFTLSEKADLQQEYIDFYRRLVRAEVSLCKPGPQTRVCHVGCGPMPLTLLMWSKYTGCTITGLDISDSAIVAAQHAVRERAAQDPKSYDLGKIELTAVPGEEFDYSGFDVVLISSTVRPKEDVCKRIATTASPTVAIVERVPCGVWRYLADSDEGLLNAFELRDKVRSSYIEIRRYSTIEAEQSLS